jgi:hypothetical protein
VNKIEEKNKKNFLVIGLVILGVVVLANLILTLNNPYFTFVNLFNNENNTNNELWAMRGQIGDVLSGHFTALAFIGLLISLQYQRKSIEQMSIAINQQNKNLIRQSKILKLQIKEFEQQTEEFKEQTTEFKINNFLQIIARNYSRLNDFEVSFTYITRQTKHESYRNFLNDLYLSPEIVFRDLEMLVSQLKIIETNIQFVHLPEIKEILKNEYNIYKDLYYKDKIESTIYYTFFKQEMRPILVDGYYHNAMDIKIARELLSQCTNHLETKKQLYSNLEQRLCDFFLQEIKKDQSLEMNDILKKYDQHSIDSFTNLFHLDADLIWNIEPLNISKKVE